MWYALKEKELKTEELGVDVTNKYYAPEFVEYITLEFMPFITMCGSLMLNLVDPNISRVSNAYFESHHKVIK